MTEIYSVNEIRRLVSILPNAREALTEERMIELRDGVYALLDLAENAKVYLENSWPHNNAPKAEDLKHSLTLFTDL